MKRFVNLLKCTARRYTDVNMQTCGENAAISFVILTT